MPEIHQWLIENVGDEWVDWAASVSVTFGEKNHTVTLALKEEINALLTAMRFGKVTPAIGKYP